ncbi:hypothetical protein QP185_22120 [Sphingomonas aerolata]|uniref:hypothetical protein n=1 Tax=Sphingomonas aerolata TaxID=185951 RepID=UPI002FE21A70
MKDTDRRSDQSGYHHAARDSGKPMIFACLLAFKEVNSPAGSCGARQGYAAPIEVSGTSPDGQQQGKACNSKRDPQEVRLAPRSQQRDG